LTDFSHAGIWLRVISPKQWGAALLVMGAVLVAVGWMSSPGGGAVAASTTAPVSVAAVGDIACDPLDPSFNGGAGTGTDCGEEATAGLVAAGGYNAVLPLGDLQYDCGSLANFEASYDPAWGIFSATAHPVPGNHEYKPDSIFGETGCTPDAAGYYTYFTDAGNTNVDGVNDNGYYSYTLGTWHVIAINSNCSEIGGCGAGSPEFTWVKSDLAANKRRCTLAYWHYAPWASNAPTGGVALMRPMWKMLVNHHVDLVLAGHFHDYERFAEMDGLSAPVADGTGTREIVVGTGGEHSASFAPTPLSGSQVRATGLFGILDLTLAKGSYSWSFVPAAPATFTDSGTDTCH
jgi:hypothetical protein